MTGFDANEHMLPFRDACGYGGILFDRTQLRQPNPAWFDPGHWGDAAQPVSEGGRGGAWFIQTGEGDAVLRHYLRGGWMARLSRDSHLWRGIHRVRSFAEFRLLRVLRERKLPVPLPFAAWYRREGATYRAAILMQRLPDVRSLAALASAGEAPWEDAGELLSRCHRGGLDHADLNAHNILFGVDGRGWLIDVDGSRIRIPATRWREANLARLRRSLLKQRGGRATDDIESGWARLRVTYDKVWSRGY